MTEPNVEALSIADRQLAALSKELRLLLNITPTNAEEAWADFNEGGFRNTPVFRYRPLGFEVDRFKRELFEIDLEGVTEPALVHLLEEKRTELDRGASLLQDRDTPRFLPGCIQAFGDVDDDLLAEALQILSWGPDELVDDRGVTREEFAARAREEIALYREFVPEFDSVVEIRDDMSGIMVQDGDLLLGKDVVVAERRVEPLIHHEVGTHVFTWQNGRKQPISLLSTGLASYDETQEALALFAEYAIGGLDARRLELIAGRVVAARRVTEGVSFPRLFEELVDERGFDRRSAWNTTMRAFRAGGTTKDAIYLRGILRLLAYLESGRALEPLFVGKLPLEVAPLVEELLHAGALLPPAARPRWTTLPGASERISAARNGLAIEQLTNKEAGVR